MRNTFIHKVLSLLLAAALLLDSAGVYGYGHAHTDGKVSHAHAKRERATLWHSHPHLPKENQPTEVEKSLIVSPVCHIHMTILGFDISIPQREDSQNAGDETQALSFVRLLDDCTVARIVSSAEGELLQWLIVPLDDSDIVAKRATINPIPQVSSAPLCDSARFERSGVLLT